jgi:RNA polymerase sigma-70 factor, ECF subfamily
MTGLEWRVAKAGEGQPPVRGFSGFYEMEYRRTLRIVYALCGSWSVAEEVCQDAFLRAYRDWDDIAQMERADAWVRRVACNLATSRFRRLMLETRAVARWAVRRGPEHAQELPGELDRFWRHVRRLPSRQAQAVALRYADDLSVSDVAEVMGCAEGTVKAHLHAARQRLAEMYQSAPEEH